MYNMTVQLAWRNIWRNPRRTAVLLCAVIIGVWSMVFLGALMRGIAEGMVKNGIETLTGHIQIHHKGYRDDPAVENSIRAPEKITSKLAALLPAEARWTSRVRVNAVASNARHSRGVTLVGIDPPGEAEVSFIGRAVADGRYLARKEPHHILVGEALLDTFDTRIGHKLVLMSQDLRGEIASRAFRIVGVFRAELEATEKRFVFVTRSAAQSMLQLGEGLSEISIRLPQQEQTRQTAARLQKALSGDQYEVHTWRELLPLLTTYLKLYDGFVFIWYLVVFIAMGFGIVNTTLMAVFERIREFGLLKALGMRPWRIIRQILTESCLILLIGMAVGNALASWGVYALSNTGIDLSAFAAGAEFANMSRIVYPAIVSRDFFLANLVVLVLGLLVSLYPAVKAGRILPVKAMAHV